jgi:hypothetical protein
VSPLDLIPWWGKLAAAGAIAVAVIAGVEHVHGLQVRDTAHRQCVAAVAGKPGAKPVGDVCEESIAAAAVVAAQAQACDAQLITLKAGAPAVCSDQVRRLATDRDVKAGEAENLRTQLGHAKTDADAAVARAVTRARSADQHATTAQAAIAAAPRQPDGTLDLDADRLCLITACPGVSP